MYMHALVHTDQIQWNFTQSLKILKTLTAHTLHSTADTVQNTWLAGELVPQA